MRLARKFFTLRFPLLTSPVVVICVVLTTASVASGQQSNSRLRKAIEAANAEFSAVFARGDGAGVAELYASDGQLLQPNGNIVSGREAIRTFWQGGIDSGLKQVKLNTTEVYGAGGIVAEVGTYSVLGADGQVMESGKYVVLWKREKGKWRLYRDIWNTNTPART